MIYLGELLSDLAHQLEFRQVIVPEMLSILESNEAILWILESFTTHDKLSGLSNIGFLASGGIKPLCNIYISLCKEIK